MLQRITYNRIEFNTWLCVCLMSIHLSSHVYVRYCYANSYVIIVKKYFDPRSSPPIYKNLHSRCHCMQNGFISNEIERRIGNSKYKKQFFFLHIRKKKFGKKNSHTRRTHIYPSTPFINIEIFTHKL